jgi:hypothetical protein
VKACFLKDLPENKSENAVEQVFSFFFARSPAAAHGICNPPRTSLKDLPKNKRENSVKQVFSFVARLPAAAKGICNPPQNKKRLQSQPFYFYFFIS